MKPANHFVKQTIFVFLFILGGSAFCNAQQQPLLIVNSNIAVEKYKLVQDIFINSIGNNRIKIVDLKDKDQSDELNVKDMKSLNPLLLYCIGTKAFYYGTTYFPDNHIIFSSVINWRRFKLTQNMYGVSNELHPRMPLYIVKSLFPTIQKIGILYSEKFTREWFEDVQFHGNELGIEIIGQSVSDKKHVESALNNLLQTSHAIWLIPDPVIIPDKTYLFKIIQLCDQNKKPVISYHEAFVNIGAALVVSVDEPTVGKQAAGIALDIISGKKPDDKVQFPAGSSVTLDLNKINSYQLEYNSDALGLVNNLIK